MNVALTKTFSFGDYRIRGRFDIYNLFNDSTVLNANANFGSSWLRPTSIIGGRLLKFQAEVDF